MFWQVSRIQDFFHTDPKIISWILDLTKRLQTVVNLLSSRFKTSYYVSKVNFEGILSKKTGKILYFLDTFFLNLVIYI
jgi:hypothetical protein